MSFAGAHAARLARGQRERAAAARRDSAATTPRSSMGDLHVREVGKELITFMRAEKRCMDAASENNGGRSNHAFSFNTLCDQAPCKLTFCTHPCCSTNHFVHMPPVKILIPKSSRSSRFTDTCRRAEHFTFLPIFSRVALSIGRPIPIVLAFTGRCRYVQARKERRVPYSKVPTPWRHLAAFSETSNFWDMNELSAHPYQPRPRPPRLPSG